LGARGTVEDIFFGKTSVSEQR